MGQSKGHPVTERGNIWDVVFSQPIYTAPEGRTIIGMAFDDSAGELIVTLDNRQIVRVAVGKPAGATLQ
jgi:hypothetical protein